jgi:hypothetical protein
MIDVVISFDSTGSMGPCISTVRQKVESFITQLFDSVDGLRMSIINHGSYCDGAKLIDICDFTDNRSELIRFLRATRNTGGCDMSHASYEYVLHSAASLSWSADNRALILIGDCEPHPIGYRQGIPEGVKLDWKECARKLVVEKAVKFFPIQAMNRSQHTHFYKSLAAMTDTPKLDLMQFSDVAEYLTAVIYAHSGNTSVEDYATKLQTQGLFNRNIAGMFNTLLGTDKYNVPTYVTTRYTGDKYDIADGLKEVDPARFQVLHIDHDTAIKDFVLSTGAVFKIGRGFYELTKSETVQEHKEVVLRDKRTGDMFSGKVARDMIGLPYGERGTVRPRYGFDYDVFIQSTSANRVLKGKTRFLYEAK